MAEDERVRLALRLRKTLQRRQRRVSHVENASSARRAPAHHGRGIGRQASGKVGRGRVDGERARFAPQAEGFGGGLLRVEELQVPPELPKGVDSARAFVRRYESRGAAAGVEQRGTRRPLRRLVVPAAEKQSVVAQQADGTLPHRPEHEHGFRRLRRRGGQVGVGESAEEARHGDERPARAEGAERRQLAQKGDACQREHREPARHHERHKGRDREIRGESEGVDRMEQDRRQRQGDQPWQKRDHPGAAHAEVQSRPPALPACVAGSRDERIRRQPASVPHEEARSEREDGVDGEGEQEARAPQLPRLHEQDDERGGAPDVGEAYLPPEREARDQEREHEVGAHGRHREARDHDVQPEQDDLQDAREAGADAQQAAGEPEEACDQPYVHPADGEDVETASPAKDVHRLRLRPVARSEHERAEHLAVRIRLRSVGHDPVRQAVPQSGGVASYGSPGERAAQNLAFDEVRLHRDPLLAHHFVSVVHASHQRRRVRVLGKGDSRDVTLLERQVASQGNSRPCRLFSQHDASVERGDDRAFAGQRAAPGESVAQILPRLLDDESVQRGDGGGQQGADGDAGQPEAGGEQDGACGENPAPRSGSAVGQAGESADDSGEGQGKRHVVGKKPHPSRKSRPARGFAVGRKVAAGVVEELLHARREEKLCLLEPAIRGVAAGRGRTGEGISGTRARAPSRETGRRAPCGRRRGRAPPLRPPLPAS